MWVDFFGFMFAVVVVIVAVVVMVVGAAKEFHAGGGVDNPQIGVIGLDFFDY